MKNQTFDNMKRAAVQSAVVRRLGAVDTRRAICPGCGKIAEVEGLAFTLAVDERRIKEVTSIKADGVKWCETCR